MKLLLIAALVFCAALQGESAKGKCYSCGNDDDKNSACTSQDQMKEVECIKDDPMCVLYGTDEKKFAKCNNGVSRVCQPYKDKGMKCGICKGHLCNEFSKKLPENIDRNF